MEKYYLVVKKGGGGKGASAPPPPPVSQNPSFMALQTRVNELESERSGSDNTVEDSAQAEQQKAARARQRELAVGRKASGPVSSSEDTLGEKTLLGS